MRATVIHGPNLNLLGSREPEVYGSSTLEEVNELIRVEALEMGWEVEVHQSAREGEIIELLHAAVGRSDGALLNPAAYSHTSRAIAEAVRAVPFPVIEVHLSNIHAREPWRRRSVTAEAAVGLIAGFGPSSYVLGLRALERLLA
jgi:3-dehydroquinate dehydratase II